MIAIHLDVRKIDILERILGYFVYEWLSKIAACDKIYIQIFTEVLAYDVTLIKTSGVSAYCVRRKGAICHTQGTKLYTGA
jgi:hypothetical protein